VTAGHGRLFAALAAAEKAGRANVTALATAQAGQWASAARGLVLVQAQFEREQMLTWPYESLLIVNRDIE